MVWFHVKGRFLTVPFAVRDARELALNKIIQIEKYRTESKKIQNQMLYSSDNPNLMAHLSQTKKLYEQYIPVLENIRDFYMSSNKLDPDAYKYTLYMTYFQNKKEGLPNGKTAYSLRGNPPGIYDGSGELLTGYDPIMNAPSIWKYGYDLNTIGIDKIGDDIKGYRINIDKWEEKTKYETLRKMF